MKALFTLSFFVFFFCSQLFAQSSVWKVSDGNHTMYIGGTIHVLRASDFPLPKEFDEAYNKSDYVVFETDIALSKSRTFTMSLAKKMLLPSDQSLSKILLPQTYQQLCIYLDTQGYGIAQFEQLEPWALMLTLTQLKLEQMGINQSGVDETYFKKAAADHKPQRYLETAEKQIEIITKIGKDEEDALVQQTLRDMDELDETMGWMVHDWREGKTKRLELEMVGQMLEESPKMYRLILTDRNEAWMSELYTMIRAGKTGFVLVGTMHLLGPDGLLQRFQREGYRVEPL